MCKSMRRVSGQHHRVKAVGGLAIVAALTLAACSSGDGSSASTTKADTTDLSKVDSAKVQEFVNGAFQGEVAVDSLPETVQESFKRASLTLTSAQQDKAFECWSKGTCTIGDGKVTLGIADGFGDNQWRKFTKMEAILQAFTYPQIGKIIYTDAQGDLAKMQSNIRSLAAQGAKAIVTYDDFGAAAVPAYEAVQKQGVKVSSYVGGIPDAPVSAVANQVKSDGCQAGKDMAKVVVDDYKVDGDIAILNGAPGNPQGAVWNKCVEDALAGSTAKVGTKVDTSWTPAGTFKAASALVSSGKDYKAVLHDYADPLTQVVAAYEKAGKVSPSLVTWSGNNGLLKLWADRQGTDKAFELHFTNSLNWEARVSVTAVMNLLEGKDVPAEIIVPQPFVKATKAMYAPDRPADYPGTSVLIPDALVTRMLK